ncbi:GMC family oxidoreductase [Pseudoglutamicibacter albus]|uniref:Choline dehydrogenase n=1 Tax=Pseudoglutamicibacter albus TaxID=98671 RepID=A0ABU1YXB7_9MICC|nr:GMC family oxidoreductase N-terminal domain-containing protein [Pseudoglutamicibacter albus]MDR7292868.1 choline dehydrogenase [Pseudoglutamicibacter albus]
MSEHNTETSTYRATDCLVIGAGSAGSVIARRLLDAGHTVTVVEAGGQDANPDIDDVSRLGLLWSGPHDWDFATTPQANAANQQIQIPRGKVLGGSHALNATIWVRGAKEDFDGWATEHDCAGWGWDDVLPYFKAIENYPEGDPETRGHDGPLDVRTDYSRHPIQQAMYDAAVAAGMPENPDYNSGEEDGVAWMQLNIRDKKRFNTWRAYLKPEADNPNLQLITNAEVETLTLDGKKVTGARVIVNRDGAEETVDLVAGETVLAAGALGSPVVLMRSGIGPADHLKEAGVDVVHDLPGVGQNLHDHLLSPVVCTTEKELPPVVEAAAQVHFFAKSSPDQPVVDTQPIFFSVPMYTRHAAFSMTGPDAGFSLLAGIVRPKSRGSIKLTGPGVKDPLEIDLSAYEHPDDLEAMKFSLRQCREIASQPQLTEEWGATELYPGPEVTDSDADLEEYIRATSTTYHHQVGTCAMGTGEDAVVDPETFRVYGVDGLRVADASIMPVVTSGNTNAPSVMIGEKAAAHITGKQPF